MHLHPAKRGAPPQKEKRKSHETKRLHGFLNVTA